MRRRDLVGLITCGTVVWPVESRAQQQAIPLIGFLGVRSLAEATHLVAAFRQGLDETGWTEGRNIAIDYRWAGNQYNRLPELVADLVARRVAVIAATGGGVSVLAARAATSTIPIVFVMGDLDPVKSGLANSLSRPGGNITGITPFTSVLGPKRLQLLHELVPNAVVIGMLVNPGFADSANQSSEAREAARYRGTKPHY